MTAISNTTSLNSSSARRFLNEVVNPLKWSKLWERQRLRAYDRHTPTTTSLLDQPTRIVDTASFLSAYRAIFEDEIYAFKPADQTPSIIDGGANVGLATLYWKKKWPEADVTAFEPDPQVFEVLEWNCNQHGYPDVNLIQKGLWSKNGTLQFDPDGADAGQVRNNHTATGKGRDDTESVRVVRLAKFLDQPIDLLKLDIEGAESEVLLDCEGALDTVENLFVEYHSYIDREQRVDEVLRVLRDSGFRIHIQPELVADQPFVQRLESYGMDHRLNIFAYRNE
ncbi:FkbM family methyltransferase [Salinibacter ruber]|uniref:FkbM family methyltransferase n=1 Tax=Salinibacter ruber TaxID=146919 RepID=A0AAW5P8J7_9BACT|nr:FkbM family methyltransferase [Salinibacter ruber]MCS4157958.1 FkbM family methyltransferase [Salinibacter ruber]